MARNRNAKKPQQAQATQAQSQDKPVYDKNPSYVYVCSHLHKGVIFNMPDGRKVRVAGKNDNLRGRQHAKLIVDGGVYTKMAPDDWAFIKDTFKDWPAVKNELLYAVDSVRNAKAAIRDHLGLRDGFEPIDPKKAKTEQALAPEVS